MYSVFYADVNYLNLHWDTKIEFISICIYIIYMCVCVYLHMYMYVCMYVCKFIYKI